MLHHEDPSTAGIPWRLRVESLWVPVHFSIEISVNNTEKIRSQKIIAEHAAGMGPRYECLLPPGWAEQVQQWLREDIPSFDYGGFVVGDAQKTALLYCKAQVPLRAPSPPLKHHPKSHPMQALFFTHHLLTNLSTGRSCRRAVLRRSVPAPPLHVSDPVCSRGGRLTHRAAWRGPARRAAAWLGSGGAWWWPPCRAAHATSCWASARPSTCWPEPVA